MPGQQKNDAGATGKLILAAIYVLFGMAILAMCFDLMQEEIVAKFRWIGRKIGIIEKEQDPNEPPNDKGFDDNNEKDRRRPSTASSVMDPSPTMNKKGKLSDDDNNDGGWPSRPNSNATRKLSPRNISSRVHPMGKASNEGTLHQRAPANKTH